MDNVFTEKDNTQTVYQKAVSPILDNLLSGFNATVFAYGMTGAGKTYTMMGTSQNPGVMFLSMRELFSRINTITDKKYVIKITYVQVYNEVIQDLLTAESKPLEIREEPVAGTCLAGVSEIITNSP